VDEDEPDRDELRTESLEILLVEDDDDHADLAERALTRDTDWTVERVDTVESARRRLDDGSFDLVVLDYDLPDGDGLDILDFLRDARRSDPVVFLTGQGSEDVAMEAMQRGALDYLVKGPGLLDRLQRRALEALQDWRAIGTVLETGPTPSQRSPSEGTGTRDVEVDRGGLLEELEAIVEGPVTGAIVRTPESDTVSTNLPKEATEAELGDILSDLHADLSRLGRFDGLTPRRWATVIQTSEHLLAVSVAPGPLLIGLLLRPSTGSMIALRRAQEGARRIWEAA
jgi:CheY-like chemotaxis protein